MVARALQACGLWLGRVAPATPDNRLGFFENESLREINKEILAALGTHRLGVRSMPALKGQEARYAQIGELKARCQESIEGDGYKGEVWGFKDPKMSLIWPIWREAFPDALWVIVKRPSEAVIRSCARSEFLKQYGFGHEDWTKFVGACLSRIAALERCGVPYLGANADEIATGNLTALETIVCSIPGLDWNEAAVRASISTNIWTRS
ncbi:MAG: hypothetical protein GY791_08265 [Alphaproteobacteria bacterium]|nr:hypothetical protein [Alphaproteobacteria bacterium]